MQYYRAHIRAGITAVIKNDSSKKSSTEKELFTSSFFFFLQTPFKI